METTKRPADFDGVFRFTNCSNEEFMHLWNNKEYVFPPKSTCPMIIEGETLENIQEIRKRFALDYAKREYFKSKGFQKIKNGDGRSVLSSFDEKALQPYVDSCLEPLPVAEVTKRKVKGDDESNYKGSKALKDGSNLNMEFKDADVQVLGEMPS